MAILGRKRSSMRQQAAPVAQTRAPVAQQRAVVAQTKAPVAQRTGIAPAPAKTYNEIQLAELRKADQALGNVPKSTYSPADIARIQQEQSKKMLQQPQQTQQASGLRAVAPATPQQNVASLQAAKVAATRNEAPQQAQRTGVVPAPAAQVPQAPSKAMQSYMAAEKAGTAGNMAKPAFRKGGAVKKKTGYAKGGAVMCGASVPPAQKRKK